MVDWANVRWTQARQIVALTNPKAAADVPETVTPADYLATLRAGGRGEEAVTYIGLALPRFDGIVWAARMLAATPAPAGSPEAAVRAAIDAWIKQPDDARRRDVWEAGKAADDWSAERLLSHAVFLSGGSLAPPGLPAVQPRPDLSGRMAASAIVVAAHSSQDAPAAIERALDAGEAAARQPTR